MSILTRSTACEDCRRPPGACRAAALLAAILLSLPAGHLRAAADERDPQPQASPTPSPRPKAGAPKKRARPAPPPAPAAAPSSGGAPPTGGASGPSPAAGPAAKTLSFTDDDLRKYHQGRPADEEETAGETVTQSGAAADAPPLLQSKAVAGKRPPAKPAVSEDPLKKYHDQEQAEKMRAEQIQKLREQIAQAQARIEALKLKRAAILDPYRIMPKPESADAAQEEAKLKPKELLDRVDEEIAKAGGDLEELQQSLVKIEARFQAEQRP
jgi:hypothetical protein